jgi:hypothetical protein
VREHLADHRQDEAARQKFDLDPGHDRLKVCLVKRFGQRGVKLM